MHHMAACMNELVHQHYGYTLSILMFMWLIASDMETVATFKKQQQYLANKACQVTFKQHIRIYSGLIGTWYKLSVHNT